MGNSVSYVVASTFVTLLGSSLALSWWMFAILKQENPNIRNIKIISASVASVLTVLLIGMIIIVGLMMKSGKSTAVAGGEGKLGGMAIFLIIMIVIILIIVISINWVILSDVVGSSRNLPRAQTLSAGLAGGLTLLLTLYTSIYFYKGLACKPCKKADGVKSSGIMSSAASMLGGASGGASGGGAFGLTSEQIQSLSASGAQASKFV